MVNRPKIAGTNAESLVREYCKENGWPYAKRLSLSGAKDVGDIDLHPKLVIEVKSTTKSMKIGPWMNEVDQEQIHADADYGILVIKYPGVGARNVGKFLTCMRVGGANHLIGRGAASQGRVRNQVHGVKQQPVHILRAMDLNLFTESYMSSVTHRMRGAKLAEQDYHFMWLQDRLHLLRVAGYGETRHLQKEETRGSQF